MDELSNKSVAALAIMAIIIWSGSIFFLARGYHRMTNPVITPYTPNVCPEGTHITSHKVTIEDKGTKPIRLVQNITCEPITHPERAQNFKYQDTSWHTEHEAQRPCCYPTECPQSKNNPLTCNCVYQVRCGPDINPSQKTWAINYSHMDISKPASYYFTLHADDDYDVRSMLIESAPIWEKHKNYPCALINNKPVAINENFYDLRYENICWVLAYKSQSDKYEQWTPSENDTLNAWNECGTRTINFTFFNGDC